MAKFTKLNIGDSVASSGGRAWKKLSAESGLTDGNYLTFSSPNSFTLKVGDNTKHWDGTLEYSTDTSTWNTWDGTTALSADNGKLYMRGIGNTRITDANIALVGWRWVLTGSEISCNGNIENLLDYQTVANGTHPTMADNAFNSMFYNCTALTKAPELPATTLADNCYASMFVGCTNLIIAPELPATTLTLSCYGSMFHGCTNLTNPPKLPATTLAEACYMDMFAGCTNLIAVPELPATNLIKYCYFQMFQECAKIKLSTTQTGDYQTAYRIPTSGTGATATNNTMIYMFSDTGGTFTGNPAINTTYYTSNTVV
jgi:hypothetical protein